MKILGLAASIHDCNTPARVQQDDGTNVGAFVPYEIEARVRKDLLQFERPFVKGDRLQKLGGRTIADKVAVTPDHPQGVLGRMDDHAPAIEHDAIVACPQRPLGEKVTQQIFVILPDRLRQYAFHMLAYGNGERETLRVES